MKALDIKITVTPKDEAVGTFGLVGAVMPYFEKIKEVPTPEGFTVECHVEEPRIKKTKSK
jgi:hypothetical protein